jgi:hypothetical protein
LLAGVFALLLADCTSSPTTPERSGGASAWSRFGQRLRTLVGDDDACPVGDPTGPARTQPEPGADETVVAVKKKAWEAQHGGLQGAIPFIQARLGGWPSTVLADKQRLPDSDAAFLQQLAADTWQGLQALHDKENGLPIDSVSFGRASVALGDSHIGDYTNVTTIGLRLATIAAAYELELLSRPQAVAAARQILATLQRLERHAGFFFNFYDTTSEERTSNFISFVDSSWLTAGLIVTRVTFAELYAECTELIDQGDYRFFYDSDFGLMLHGYFVPRASRSRFHYGMLYAESRLGSLLAIGKGDVPAAHWFKMTRTFPSGCNWQSRPPRGRHPKELRGERFRGGWYEWEGTRYVPSWGGSMFEALMPTLLLDEPRHASRNLGANDLAHAVVQRRYALEQLGYPVWGMSPSLAPSTTSYTEFGVPVLGAVGYQPGAVTPHAAALALAVTPQQATANLRELARRYDLYGEYGLYDAVDPRSGEVIHAYLGLDQAMTFLALANHLKDGCVQRRFESDPIVQRVLPLLAEESFFE